MGAFAAQIPFQTLMVCLLFSIHWWVGHVIIKQSLEVIHGRNKKRC